jgi:hypothetical protein
VSQPDVERAGDNPAEAEVCAREAAPRFFFGGPLGPGLRRDAAPDERREGWRACCFERFEDAAEPSGVRVAGRAAEVFPRVLREVDLRDGEIWEFGFCSDAPEDFCGGAEARLLGETRTVAADCASRGAAFFIFDS